MNRINIQFYNQTKYPVTVFLEFSTDEFVLKPDDKIRICCESKEEISMIESSMIDSEYVVVYVPFYCQATVYFNDDYVWSMAESFWS
ncbi:MULTISPECIES: hypothetical protein [unclassified Acinetobacter]|uniref:hypothetical protein n=1 Tax=unclassified Acinetobacter TaxID=196816 RepID=UPI002576BC7D|nr:MULTISPECIES: hypothetical protein [unclassified Acinetobacter]MDM1766001.1 hypothetical protein [Acinetobacter sp. 226-1]MDM1769763.1 hypothetical protein [Acinetobacter sp. 226-4]